MGPRDDLEDEETSTDDESKQRHNDPGLGARLW